MKNRTPGLHSSGYGRLLSGLSKEVLYTLADPKVVKLQAVKVGGKKNLRHFLFEATFFAIYLLKNQ